MRTSLIVKGLLAAAALAPMLASAESNVQTGAGALTATAHVDFQITIPKFLFLRVGTGTGTALGGGFATLGTVDLITWAPTPAQVGSGALAGTGGELGGGVETAVVVGNSGNVTFSGATLGALGDGAGDTISYTKICVASAANTTGTVLTHPGAGGACNNLTDGATTTSTLTAVAKIVQQDAKWTYSYANNTSPPAGTYGGINTNNGRVTYTASVP
jgi:hypothetical protein